jgi:hypothetical protein
MAHDAEMTPIPPTTEPGARSATAERPKENTTDIFGRLKKKLLFAEDTVVFFKHLSILGLVGGVIGTAVGSYFQYVSWREEQNIARYKEDFAAGTAVFSDVASTLSTAVNLQQILYFTFRDAVDAGVAKMMMRSKRRRLATPTRATWTHATRCGSESMLSPAKWRFTSTGPAIGTVTRPCRDRPTP